MADTPLALKPSFVPTTLRAYDSWLLWKLEKSDRPNGKPLKVPYYASGHKRKGELGVDKDRAKLVSFKDAVAKWKASDGRYTGIGFATMPDFPITILDLDDCIDKETGEYSQFAQEVIASGTYVERSPSGYGLRAVYTGGAIVAGKRNGHIASGERVEIYCGNAFVTITGQRLPGVGLDAIELPKALHKTLGPIIGGNGTSNPSSPVKLADGDTLMPIEAAPIPELELEHARVVLSKLPNEWGAPGHGTWYRVAAALHLQFNGSEAAYEVLDEWSQGLDGYDEGANRARWDAGFSHDHGKGTLTTFKNLVFEAVQKGGLRVKKETMQKWGLARKVEDDFDIDPTEPDGFPEPADFLALGNIYTMLHEPAPPVDWLVEDFIPRGQVSILGGGSGTSKSFLVMIMAMYGASGLVEEFAKMPITPKLKTLYLAYEDAALMLHGRIQTISRHIGEAYDTLSDREYLDTITENLTMISSEVLDSGNYMFAVKKGKFDVAESTNLCEYLTDICKTHGYDMVVIDTGSESHSADENNASDMVQVMRALRSLASIANVGVLVVHHVSKDIWKLKLEEMNQASVRGSSVMVDKARNVFLLARMPRADAEKYNLPNTAETHDDYIALKHVKANMGRYMPVKVFERANHGMLVYRQDIQEAAFAPIDNGEESDDARSQKMQRKMAEWKEQVLDYIKARQAVRDRPSQTQISAAMMDNAPGFRAMRDQEVRLALARLEEEGQIKKYTSKRDRSVRFVLAQDHSDDEDSLD